MPPSCLALTHLESQLRQQTNPLPKKPLLLAHPRHLRQSHLNLEESVAGVGSLPPLEVLMGRFDFFMGHMVFCHGSFRFTHGAFLHRPWGALCPYRETQTLVQGRKPTSAGENAPLPLPSDLPPHRMPPASSLLDTSMQGRSPPDHAWGRRQCANPPLFTTCSSSPEVRGSSG